MLSWPFLSLLLLATPALADPIIGRASVIDGDTLDVRGTRIRLHGIDAPESAQVCKDAAGKDYRCGQTAALALSDHVGKRLVSCDPRDTDRYGRVVAVCRAGAEDLNAWMVRQGHAIAYRRYAEDYVNAELTAKALRHGIWAGTFQEPSEWRREKRAGGEHARPETVTPPSKASGSMTGLASACSALKTRRRRSAGGGHGDETGAAKTAEHALSGYVPTKQAAAGRGKAGWAMWLETKKAVAEQHPFRWCFDRCRSVA